MSGIEAVMRFQAEKRRCREIYGGDCGIFVGPPDWDHRVDGHKRPKHPTREQALLAAHNPNTPPDCLRALGKWDEELYADVRNAARANSNYGHFE
jgi:hypothetical protein